MASGRNARPGARPVADRALTRVDPYEAVHVAHRLQIEQAVVRASLLLGTPGELNKEELLEIIGESTEADCVYFQSVPPDDRPLVDLEQMPFEADLVLWRRHEEASPRIGSVEHLRADDAGANAVMEACLQDRDVVAVPILPSTGRFYGYLGIAHQVRAGAWRDEDTRLLNVLGDMLASHIERRRAETALQQSEERWRTLVERNPEAILIAQHGRIVYVNPCGVRLFGFEAPEEILERSFYDFISADDHTAVETSLRRQLAGEMSDPFRHEIARHDGEWRIVESLAVATMYGDGDAMQLVIRDLTERTQSDFRYRTFAETISEGIWHVRLTEAVSTATDAELQVQGIQQCGVLTECNQVMMHVLGGADSVGTAGERLWKHLPLDRLVADLLRSGYRLRNWPFALPGPNGSAQHYLLNVVGTVERGCLSGLWGSCIEVTEAVELEQRMVNALEEQQQQIGRDLHDGVGQLLTGVRMLTQVLVESFGDQESGSAELARKIMRYAEEASQQVRTIYYGLTPAQLTMDGLAAALDELAINTDVIPGIRSRFERDGLADVTDMTSKLHLYRIAQEAVNNSLKHSKADFIRLTLGAVDGRIELRITDNGLGFDPPPGNKKSLGVQSMYYRARAVGADLAIEPGPEGGTVVRCLLPASQEAAGRIAS